LVNIFILAYLLVYYIFTGFNDSLLLGSIMMWGVYFFAFTLIIDIFVFYYWGFVLFMSILEWILDFYRKVESKEEKKYRNELRKMNIYPLKGFFSLLILLLFLFFNEPIFNRIHFINKKLLKWINSYLFVLCFSLCVEIIFLFVLLRQISRNSRMNKKSN